MGATGSPCYCVRGTPTAMLLQFGKRGTQTLEISADLFELLLRFAMATAWALRSWRAWQPI